MENKVARLFSKPLMKQNIKSNIVLIIIITLIMVMMSTVMNFAMSKMVSDTENVDVTEYQTEFYTYLGAMANYNATTGSALSYEGFISAEDKSEYENVFEMLNKQGDLSLSAEGFQNAIDGLETGGTSVETYIRQFEYNYVLMQNKNKKNRCIVISEYIVRKVSISVIPRSFRMIKKIRFLLEL